MRALQGTKACAELLQAGGKLPIVTGLANRRGYRCGTGEFLRSPSGGESWEDGDKDEEAAMPPLPVCVASSLSTPTRGRSHSC